MGPVCSDQVGYMRHYLDSVVTPITTAILLSMYAQEVFSNTW